MRRIGRRAENGTVGPVEQHLKSFQCKGKLVQQLVFGAFGDVSEDFDVLVQDTATTGARKHWRKMQCKSPAEAFGLIVWKIRKLLGVAILLAQARLVMDGIRWCGPGSAAAASRLSCNSESTVSLPTRIESGDKPPI